LGKCFGGEEQHGDGIGRLLEQPLQDGDLVHQGFAWPSKAFTYSVPPRQDSGSDGSLPEEVAVEMTTC
jgi:hypothetical protein